MISPVPSSTPVNQALTDLRSSIGALNGERSQLERHEPGSNYQEIEAAVDYILGLATSKVQAVSPDETLVLGNGSNRISLVEKLDQIAALLESDQQRAALSDVISSNGVDQSLQKIQKLRSDLDLLHTTANKQQADPFLATMNFAPASTPVPGSSVAPTRFEDQYSIVGKIGEGGMGTVLRVRNDKLERDEAAKMIQPRPGESESDQQMKLSRFREEVRISAQLAPAGFVQTYDIFTTADNKVGFTMELIEGGVNLERLIRAYKEVMFKSEAPSQKQPGRAALEATVLGFDATADNAEIETDGPSSPDAKLDARAVLSQVLRITPSGKNFSRTEQKSLTKALVDKLIDVCHNVQIMHELGFIHRDIKPANILIDKQGKVRLADAGLAEEIDRLKTKAPGISGTPQYMAPEQIIGDPKREGVHTDIYGIGAILYEVICGKTQITVKPDAPFSLAMLNPIKDGTIPKAIRPGIFGFTFHDLEAVCQKAMAPDPEKRFQSVAQLADELTAWVRGAEVPTYATSAPPAVRLIYGLGSRIANHPFMTLGLSGGTLATFVGGFFGLKALDAKSEFDRLSVRAVEVYRRNDPDALGASLELHRQAHTVIAPYALTFENLGFSDIGRNTLVRREIEHEISERRQASSLFERFTRDAGSALRAASSDFSTYYATDRTAKLLEQALSEQIPDMFDPRAASALIESLSHRALEPEERREIILLTAQCFESRASKLPFHPDLGLKHAGDADRGLQLLKNARRLYQEAEVPLSTSELMLELRFRRDMLKVAEGRSSFRAQPDHANASAQTQRIEPLKIEIERLNAKLIEVPPVTARDYYTLGKIAFFDRADDVEALRCFEKALEILETPEGDNPAAQDPSITFGAMYGKGQALVRLGRSEEANTAFSEARRAIKNLNLDESMGSDLFAMTTSKVAHSYLVSYTARYGGDTANLTPEQNQTIVSLYDQSNRASPHNIAVLNAYGHYLLKRNDSERALAIYSDLVTSHPEFNYGFAQRGFINARLGRIDAAFCDYLDASGISSTSVAPDQVFATLERRITNEPQFLLENDNIDMLWKYAAGLAICANKALEAQDIEKADRYYRLTLKVMDISVTWVENRNGYGKDTLLIYEYFRTLSDRYPEDFDKLFERLKPFENFQSFRGSY